MLRTGNIFFLHMVKKKDDKRRICVYAQHVPVSPWNLSAGKGDAADTKPVFCRRRIIW